MIGLDHIQIAIPKGGEDQARAFWSDVVGLDEIEKPEALKPRGGCWFQLNGSELHLGVDDPFQPARKAHPGFRVTQIEDLAHRIGTITWDDTIRGRKRFFTTDPFGNRLEFLE